MGLRLFTVIGFVFFLGLFHGVSAAHLPSVESLRCLDAVRDLSRLRSDLRPEFPVALTQANPVASLVDHSARFRDFLEKFLKQLGGDSFPQGWKGQDIYIELGLRLRGAKTLYPARVLSEFLDVLLSLSPSLELKSEAAEYGEVVDRFLKFLSEFDGGRSLVAGVLESAKPSLISELELNRKILLPQASMPQMRLLAPSVRRIFSTTRELETEHQVKTWFGHEFSFGFILKLFSLEQETELLSRKVEAFSKKMDVMGGNLPVVDLRLLNVTKEVYGIIRHYESITASLMEQWNNPLNNPAEFRMIQSLVEARMLSMLNPLESKLNSSPYHRYILRILSDSPTYRDTRFQLVNILAVKVYP